MTQRLSRQQGMFTLHSPRDNDLTDNISEDNCLEKIIIPKELKRDLQMDLSYYGINSMTIFPDLDGLSEFVNWHTCNFSDWKNQKVGK